MQTLQTFGPIPLLVYNLMYGAIKGQTIAGIKYKLCEVKDLAEETTKETAHKHK